MAVSDGTLGVMCVCTRNRTRSVMMAALLKRHLTDAGIVARVGLAGTAPDHKPPTPGAVRQLHKRGIDVLGHRSRRLHEEDIVASDLILTAEREHVVLIASRWPAVYDRTFTLREVARLIDELPPDGARPSLTPWLVALNRERPAHDRYLAGPRSDDLADPTGHRTLRWASTAREIDRLTALVARSLAELADVAPRIGHN